VDATREREQTHAYGYALAAVLLWSTVASAFKITLRTLTPLQLLGYASVTATAALFVLLLAQRKLPLVGRCTARQWLASAALGLLNPFLYYLMLFRAYDRLPGQEAQPLNYTWAIVLPLLSVPLLRQKIRPASWGALLISFAGVYVIATRGELLAFRFRDPLGVALALGSSVVWALFWILHLRDGRDELVKLFLSFLCGTPWAIGLLAASGQLRAPAAVGLAGAVYVGLFEMGITFVLWLRALARSRTTAHVANLIFLSPFVSLVLLRVAAGERIRVASIAGLLLIVAGIAAHRRL
jgi:drug/metabolite transporter (DMT)-like permease